MLEVTADLADLHPMNAMYMTMAGDAPIKQSMAWHPTANVSTILMGPGDLDKLGNFVAMRD